MKRPMAAWNEFWFSPRDPLDLCIGRSLFFLVILLLQSHKNYANFAFAPDSLWAPVSIHRLFPRTPPAYELVRCINDLFLLSLVLSCLGLLTRLSVPVSALTALYLFSFKYSFSFGYWHDAIVVLTMAILALSRCGDSFSVDALIKGGARGAALGPSGEYAWPVRAICTLWASAFFSAGVCKLRHSGLAWGSEGLSYALRFLSKNFLENYDNPIGARIAGGLMQDESLCALLSYGAHAAELLMPLALFSSWARNLLVPTTLLMLLLIYILFSLRFVHFFGAVAVFWVPWGRIHSRLAAWVSAKAAARA